MDKGLLLPHPSDYFHSSHLAFGFTYPQPYEHTFFIEFATCDSGMTCFMDGFIGGRSIRTDFCCVITHPRVIY